MFSRISIKLAKCLFIEILSVLIELAVPFIKIGTEMTIKIKLLMSLHMAFFTHRLCIPNQLKNGEEIKILKFFFFLNFVYGDEHELIVRQTQNSQRFFERFLYKTKYRRGDMIKEAQIL